jgi:lipopolysaccharide transport system permease protein
MEIPQNMPDKPNQSSPPTIVIEPRRGWLSINWSDLWHYRELLYFLTWRDIKVRYKQTVLGILWAIIQPVVKMLVLTLIFGGMLEQSIGNYPYAVWLFAAMVPWQFFAASLQRSAESVVRDSRLIGKVYFPRLVVPLASTGSALVDFLLNLLVLAVLMLAFGIVPDGGILLVLPLALATMLAALGAGTLLSALTVAYRDFRYVVPFLIEIWFFVTPVIWPLNERVDGPLRYLVALNPMAGIAEAYRSAVLPGRPMDWALLGVSTLVAGLMFVVALYVFRRLERQFADIL